MSKYKRQLVEITTSVFAFMYGYMSLTLKYNVDISISINHFYFLIYGRIICLILMVVMLLYLVKYFNPSSNLVISFSFYLLIQLFFIQLSQLNIFALYHWLEATAIYLGFITYRYIESFLKKH